MLEVLIPLCAGIALVVFILWEEFCPERAISRKTLESGFEPELASKTTALFVLGATGVCFCLYLIANPQHPPFTGRGVLISNVLYAIFGPYGHPLLCFVLSAAAIAGGFAIKK